MKRLGLETSWFGLEGQEPLEGLPHGEVPGGEEVVDILDTLQGVKGLLVSAEGGGVIFVKTSRSFFNYHFLNY